jgi:hypothetical protein
VPALWVASLLRFPLSALFSRLSEPKLLVQRLKPTSQPSSRVKK